MTARDNISLSGPNQVKEHLEFLRQYALHWRAIGAIAPSGHRLARAMGDAVSDIGERPTVVELGPGTGAITRELASRFPGGRIIAIEANHAFAARAARSVPGATIVQGCATDLLAHLERLGLAQADIAAVVSGLPMLSLPGETGSRVLDAVRAVLRPGRRYVQFTYSSAGWKAAVPGFDRQPDTRVWLNVPPAVVLSFVRKV